ncbi:hypothetical protein CK203_104256 [Vitis vinifera]|uniref:Integrase zinc-binding domain-containing protein n=1 Tax=Vitis vinifera TaxID=29760 RepID=A0A438C6T2_VITVI|nr:hypothetical protein CK203_104256 [Vitis vinifera]
MLFDQHSSTMVLDMMRGMYFMSGLGLGQRQHGPMEFVATVDHDTPFRLRFFLTEADYRVVPCDEYRDEMDMMSMSQSPRCLSLSLLRHSTCSGCLLLRSNLYRLSDKRGSCGNLWSTHGRHMLAHKIMRTGYFWLTMETDCCHFVQRCPECQIHGDLIHAPPSELHALTSPWPFSVWGIDIIGKIALKSSSVMSLS